MPLTPGDGSRAPLNPADIPSVTWDLFQTVWPVLGLLAYLLVTFVLVILASQRSLAIAVHDRVRESKALRRRYVELVGRKNAAGSDAR